jgi:hypothetical protein
MRGNKREKEKGSHIQLRKSIKRKFARRLGISVQQLTWQSGILYRTDGGFERIVEEAKCVPGEYTPKAKTTSLQTPGRLPARASYGYNAW